MPDPAARRLNLSDPADRQRLADELVQIDAVAARYREVIRALPRESDSVDAKRTHGTRPDRAYQYCQAVLREQLAGAYQLDPAELTAQASRGGSTYTR